LQENKIIYQIYDGFTSNVTTMGFQKDCKWIYASSEDGSIKICDLRAQGFQRTYTNKEAMNSVVLHPNEVSPFFFKNLS
jgi:WD domain, G-beta repeat.